MDILKDSEMLYYGKLSFVLSGSDIFNRVEVLNMSLLNKSTEKIDFNDLELIIDAIDFKRVAIEINAMHNKMVEYRDQLRLSYDKINSLNYTVNLLNKANDDLRNKLIDHENDA